MRFEEHVRATIGAATFDRIRQRKPRAWQMALKCFEEYVKRNFDPGNTTAEFSVPFMVNDGEAPGVEEGFLTLSSAQVWSIFEPVVNSIIRLIEGQIHRIESRGKPVNGILLVGGFGQSNCLFRKLQARFGYLNPPPPSPGHKPTLRQGRKPSRSCSQTTHGQRLSEEACFVDSKGQTLCSAAFRVDTTAL